MFDVFVSLRSGPYVVVGASESTKHEIV